MNARALLARRDFRLLLIGTALSMLGDSALIIALAVWARELTGSYSAAGFTLFVLVGPSLFTPLAGLVVDRTRRRTLLVVTNLATAVVRRTACAADPLVITPQTLFIGVGAVLVGVVDFRVLLLVMAVVLVGAGGFLLAGTAGERRISLRGNNARRYVDVWCDRSPTRTPNGSGDANAHAGSIRQLNARRCASC